MELFYLRLFKNKKKVTYLTLVPSAAGPGSTLEPEPTQPNEPWRLHQHKETELQRN